MSPRQESGNGAYPQFFRQIRQLPTELGKLAGHGYYLMATTETQRRDADMLGEKFIRSVFPFFQQPDIHPSLALTSYEETVFRTVSACLADETLKAREPHYLRHPWSSPGFRQDLFAFAGGQAAWVRLSWDSGLQLPVDFSVIGRDGNDAFCLRQFIVLHDRADRLGLPYDSGFQVYQEGERIDSHDRVRINGEERMMSDEYRYIGCLPGGKDNSTPQYIYSQIKRMFTPVKPGESVGVRANEWTVSI